MIVPWPTSVTSKEKSSQQKKNAHGKKEIGHGKRKKFPAKKKKMLAAKKKLVTLIASAKIPEREGSISPSSFYG